MDTREQLVQASELIKEKRYAEARAILTKLDHPLAEQWLNKIEAIVAKQQRATSTQSALNTRATSEKPATRPTSENRAVRSTSAQPAVKPKQTQTAPQVKNSAVSDSIPASTLIIGLIGVLVLGIGGGVLLFLSSKLTYLIFLSPIIAAGLIGSALAQLFKMYKLRDWMVAGILGAIMGILAYGTYRTAEYFDYREQLYQEIVAENGAIDRGEFDVELDRFMVEETGRSGILGFISMQAAEGMTVTGRSSTSTVSSELTIGYWLLEILIFIAAPFLIIWTVLSEPFCEETGEWMVFRQIGTVSVDRTASFLQLINEGIFEDAARLMHDDRRLARTSLYITVGRCHNQSPDAIMRVKQNQGRNQKEILKQTISAEQYNALVSAV